MYQSKQAIYSIKLVAHHMTVAVNCRSTMLKYHMHYRNTFSGWIASLYPEMNCSFVKMFWSWQNMLLMYSYTNTANTLTNTEAVFCSLIVLVTSSIWLLIKLFTMVRVSSIWSFGIVTGSQTSLFWSMFWPERADWNKRCANQHKDEHQNEYQFICLCCIKQLSYFPNANLLDGH